MIFRELLTAIKVAKALPTRFSHLVRLVWRPISGQPIKIRLQDNVCLFLRGSRGVRVSDLSILEEVVQLDHYQINNLVHSGDNVLEIGGHIGMFSLIAGALSGPTGQVIVIEASPENFSLLQKNCAANPHLNIQPMHIAAAEEAGETRFIASSWNTGGHRTSNESTKGVCVPTQGLEQILDKFSTDQIDVLKIDCEGCEFAVLGAADPKTLRRIKTIIVELHRFEGDQSDSIEFLEDKLQQAGFSLKCLSEVTYPGEGFFRTVLASRSS